MNYDTELWNKYTDENKENIQNEFSKFIYFLSIGGATTRGSASTGPC